MATIRIKLPTINDVEFTIEPQEEYIPIRGSFDSGDPEHDEQTALEIERQLEYNIWAWCCVKVTAEYKGMEGTDYLGACSYESEKDFVENSGYYEGMKDRAFQELLDSIKALSI